MPKYKKLNTLKFKRENPELYKYIMKKYSPVFDQWVAIQMHLCGDPPPLCRVCNKRVTVAIKNIDSPVHFRCRYKDTQVLYSEVIKEIPDMCTPAWQGHISKNTYIVRDCVIHGNYKQLLKSALKGHSCRLCHFDNMVGKKKYTVDEWVSSFKLAHNDTYSYIDLPDEIGAETKIPITCPIHGIFYQQANIHKSGHRCPSCSNCSKLTEVVLVERLKNTHGTLYLYNKVSIDEYDATNKITLICKIHGDFSTNFHNSVKGSKCPLCMSGYNTSNKEHDWITSLNISTLKQNYCVTCNDGSILKPDGYDPTTNTVYEFNGDFWHGNPDIFDGNDINPVNKKPFKVLYEATLLKEQKYKDNGYKVVTMWENQWNKLKDQK